MRKNRFAPFFSVSCLFAGLFGFSASGCSFTDHNSPANLDNSVMSNRQELSSIGQLPVPSVDKKSVWNGDQVDLLVMDALSSCAGADHSNLQTSVYMSVYASYEGNPVVPDDYMAQVLAHANDTRAAMSSDGWSCLETPNDPDDPPLDAAEKSRLQSSANIARTWWRVRTTAACNRDLSNGVTEATSLDLASLADWTFNWAHVTNSGDFCDGSIGGNGIGAPAFKAVMRRANGEMSVAWTNLCVAQQLRKQAPGTSGASALLLSAEKQRKLIEVTRERAQIAVLQFSAILRAMDHTPLADWPGANPTCDQLAAIETNTPDAVTVPNWMTNRVKFWTTDVAKKFGADVATAIGLYERIAEEEFHMLQRSADAHADRGGTASSDAEEAWGQGSWRQRALALAYGGQPLVSIDETEPWHSTLSEIPGGAGLVLGATLPSFEAQPHYKTPISDPRTRQFEALLSQCLKGVSLNKSDPEASVTNNYLAVEHCLGLKMVANSNAPIIPGCVDLTHGHEQCLLWRGYHISPEHVEPLVTQWFEGTNVLRTASAQYYKQLQWANASNLEGNLFFTPSSDGATWESLSAFGASYAHPKEILQIAPQYAGLVPFGIPRAIASNAQNDYWMISSTPTSNEVRARESKRLVGVIPTLAMARDAILNPRSFRTFASSGSSAKALFDSAALAIPVVDAAIGPASVHIWPKTTRQTDGTMTVLRTPVNEGPRRNYWYLDMYLDDKDSYWQPSSAFVTYKVYVSRDTLAGNMALYPKLKVNGEGISEIIGQADVFDANVATKLAGTTRERLVLNTLLSLPDNGVGTIDPRTFIVEKAVYHPGEMTGEIGTLGYTERSYVLAGERVTFQGRNPLGGIHLASGGTWGDTLVKLLATQSTDRVTPKYDAFGYPTNWYPTATAQSGTQTSTADFFLDNATTAATNATAAVKTAFESLQQQQHDTATIAAARDRAAFTAEQERQQLCGETGTQDCMTIATVNYTPKITKEELNCNGDGVCENLNVYLRSIYTTITKPFPVAEPVYKDLLTAKSVPAFQKYSGGELQSLFIEQWGAVKELEQEGTALWPQASASMDKIAQANAAYGAAATLAGTECEADDYYYAFITGAYEGGQKGAAAGGALGTAVAGPGLGSMIGTSVGGIAGVFGFGSEAYEEQKQQCEVAQANMNTAQKALAAEISSAYADFISKYAHFTEVTKRVALANAAVQSAVMKAKLASATAAYEVNLAELSATTSSGLYRSYTSYDLWRAKALTENARRFAVAARRSVEARYAINLSSMSQTEPFVTGPSNWVDEIYEYDLSLPHSVGLEVGEATPDGIYPNKVLDYVENLKRFVAGYGVERPTAVSSEDVEVVQIPGPGQTVEISLPQNEALVTALAPGAVAWTFQCPDGSWKAMQLNANVDTLCDGERPTTARIGFTFDPWGRIDGGFLFPPYELRHNVRWTRLAVNLVGTGVKDCAKASDPQACYSEGFLRYNLSHVGPAWVTNYEQQWRALELPQGQIEGGKGLAAELWVDPLVHDFSDSLVSSVARSEFTERPVGGAYQLDLPLPPEFAIERLERVQILLGSTYWVSQQ